MVRGVDVFRSFFKDMTENYILIGGAACDELLSKAGLTFRATKDLDIIIVVEALGYYFVKNFWEFIKAGNYESRQKSTGQRKYYRFIKPVNEEYPFQLELFARNPDLLDLAEGTHLTPIPVEEDLSSLSAILMNDDYYNFTIDNSEVENNLHRANPKALICLKAKAFLDLKRRKENGETIEEQNVRKHKNDVIRLAALLTAKDVQKLPNSILGDLRNFIEILETEPPDYKAIGKSMGIPGLDGKELVHQIKLTFSL